MSNSWTAQSVLDLTRAFQPVCILAAAAELDVFQLVADGRNTAAKIARKMHGNQRGTAVLLDALAALKLLVKKNDRYTAAPGTLDLLTSRGRGTVLAMVRHQANCLRRWGQLAAVVTSGKPAQAAASICGLEADYAAFIEAMDNLSRPVADGIIASLPKLRFTHLLDVGGASGSWTIAFLTAYRGAKATLFDLPVVMPQARRRLGEAGLLDRVKLASGNFETDALPPGADLAWVSAIVHQNSREQNRKLFKKIHRVLAPGGQILIRDILMEESHTAPIAGALFAVNMLVATAAGGTYTVGELSEDLRSTGFHKVKVIRRDEGMHAVLAATKMD